MENLYAKNIYLCTHERCKLLSGNIPYWVVKKYNCLKKPCLSGDMKKAFISESIPRTALILFDGKVKSFEKWAASINRKKVAFSAEVDRIKPYFEVITSRGNLRRGLRLIGMSVKLRYSIIQNQPFSGSVNLLIDRQNDYDIEVGDAVLGEGVVQVRETGDLLIEKVDGMRQLFTRENRSVGLPFPPPHNMLRPINFLAGSICEACKFSVFARAPVGKGFFADKEKSFSLFCQSPKCIKGFGDEVFKGSVDSVDSSLEIVREID